MFSDCCNPLRFSEVCSHSSIDTSFNVVILVTLYTNWGFLTFNPLLHFSFLWDSLNSNLDCCNIYLLYLHAAPLPLSQHCKIRSHSMLQTLVLLYIKVRFCHIQFIWLLHCSISLTQNLTIVTQFITEVSLKSLIQSGIVFTNTYTQKTKGINENLYRYLELTLWGSGYVYFKKPFVVGISEKPTSCRYFEKTHGFFEKST